MFVKSAALAILIVAAGNAGTIVSLVGDSDALGTGAVPGVPLPGGPFDNRSPAEAAATDGSQNTDVATGFGGINADNTFVHTFTVPPGVSFAAAVLELGIAGMESNDNNPATSLFGEDALRIDGILVPEAFAGVDQGPTGYNILRINLPVFVLPQLTDGSVSVLIDLNSNAGLGRPDRVEPVFYDFSRLSMTNVPEPSSMVLLTIGATFMAIVNRRSRHAGK